MMRDLPGSSEHERKHEELTRGVGARDRSGMLLPPKHRSRELWRGDVSDRSAKVNSEGSDLMSTQEESEHGENGCARHGRCERDLPR